MSNYGINFNNWLDFDSHHIDKTIPPLLLRTLPFTTQTYNKYNTFTYGGDTKSLPFSQNSKINAGQLLFCRDYTGYTPDPVLRTTHNMMISVKLDGLVPVINPSSGQQVENSSQYAFRKVSQDSSKFRLILGGHVNGLISGKPNPWYKDLCPIDLDKLPMTKHLINGGLIQPGAGKPNLGSMDVPFLMQTGNVITISAGINYVMDKNAFNEAYLDTLYDNLTREYRYPYENIVSANYYFVELDLKTRYSNDGGKSEFLNPSLVMGHCINDDIIYYEPTRLMVDKNNFLGGTLSFSLWNITERYLPVCTRSSNSAMGTVNDEFNIDTIDKSYLNDNDRALFEDINSQDFKIAMSYNYSFDGLVANGNPVVYESLIRLKKPPTPRSIVGRSIVGFPSYDTDPVKNYLRTSGHFGMFYLNVPFDISNLVIAQRSVSSPFEACQPTKRVIRLLCSVPEANAAENMPTSTVPPPNQRIQWYIPLLNKVYRRLNLEFQLPIGLQTQQPVLITAGSLNTFNTNPWAFMSAISIVNDTIYIDTNDTTIENLKSGNYLKIVAYPVRQPFLGSYTDPATGALVQEAQLPWALPSLYPVNSVLPQQTRLTGTVGHSRLDPAGYILAYLSNKENDGYSMIIPHEIGHALGAGHIKGLDDLGLPQFLMGPNGDNITTAVVGISPTWIDPVNYLKIKTELENWNFQILETKPALNSL